MVSPSAKTPVRYLQDRIIVSLVTMRVFKTHPVFKIQLWVIIHYGAIQLVMITQRLELTRWRQIPWAPIIQELVYLR